MPKVVDYEQMRKKILIESLALFQREGYQALSMRKIAQGLGVTTGVLYHYFETREDLVQQILEFALSAPSSDFSSSGPFAERVRQSFSEIALEEEKSLTTVLLLCDFFRNLGTAEERARYFPVALEFLTSYQKSLGLEQAQQDKARIALTYLVGALILRLWTPSEVGFVEQNQAFFDLLRQANRSPD